MIVPTVWWWWTLNSKFVVIFILIPQYIFGLILLKTKWIFKLVVPSIITFVYLGCMWLIYKTGIFDMIYSHILLFSVLLLPFIFIWEIAYQILIKYLNKKLPMEDNVEK